MKIAYSDQEPDPRPGHYYVSVINGTQWRLLYGPFENHPDAIAAVKPTRQLAETVDRWAYFYAFGTVRLEPNETPPPAGIINHLLPPIPAAP